MLAIMLRIRQAEKKLNILIGNLNEWGEEGVFVCACLRCVITFFFFLYDFTTLLKCTTTTSSREGGGAEGQEKRTTRTSRKLPKYTTEKLKRK